MSFWQISVTQLSFQLGLDTAQIPAQAASAGAEAGKQLKSSFEANVAKLKMPQLKFEVDTRDNGLKVIGEALKETERQAKETAKTYKNKLGSAVKQVKSFFVGLGKVLKSQIGMFALVQTAANLLTAALLNIGRGIGGFVKEAAEMEVLMLQLEAFVGSAEVAGAAYEEFKTLAAKTPFNVKEIADAGRILLGFGVDADKAVESTKQLAVVASAVGGDMNNLARNLGQISAQQRAYTRDLTQFAIQGIPIWAELSAATGRSVSELKKLATEGKIGMDEVSVALTNMTAEGTSFQQISERMGTTLIGRMQKLGSTITDAAKNFGTFLQSVDSATGLISGFIGIFQGGMDLINNLIKTATANIRLLGTVTAGVAGLIAGIAAAAGFSALVNGIKAATIAMKAFRFSTIKAAVAQIFLLAVSGPGGWATLAIGIAVAAGAAAAFNVNLDKTIQNQARIEAQAEKDKKAADARVEREKELAKTKEGLNKLIQDGTAKLAELNKEAKENDTITKEQQKSIDDLTLKIKVWKKSYEELYGAASQATAAIKAAKEAEKDSAEAAKEKTKKLQDEKKVRDRLNEDIIEQMSDEKRVVDRNHQEKMDALDEEMEAVQEAGKIAEEAQEKTHERAMAGFEAESEALDVKTQEIEAAHDKEIQGIENLETKEESRHESRMSDIERQVEALDAAAEAQSAQTDRLKDAEKRRHDSAMAGHKSALDAAKRNYDAQIAMLDKLHARETGRLEALTPAEQELAQIRINELKAKVKDTSLSRKERLQAQAALDDIKRQKDLNNLNLNIDKERDRLAGNYKSKQDRIKDAMQREEDQHKTNIQRIEDQDKAQKDMIEAKKIGLQEIETAESTNHDTNMTRLGDRKTAVEDKTKAELDGVADEEKALNDRSENEKILHGEAMDRIQTETTAKTDGIQAEKDKLVEVKDAYDRAHTDRLEELSDKKRIVDRQHDDLIQQISDTRDAEKAAHDAKIQQLKDQHTLAMDNYAKQEKAAEDVAAAQSKTEPVNTPSVRTGRRGVSASARNRASGGPVSGGTTYTVNELGKEAFLSASGQLSMIKAPAWGKWKAPGKGTVIPAHLTSQMSIPNGGVKIDSGAHANSMKAAQGGGLNRLVSAIRNSANGGNYNNQVTIQSVNPNQTASDMLVSLNRIKRRRYS